ncbi:MAG: MATE family efflux transporter [Mediterranea sp.]|jgi:putative MATE family efflux protein|nr:MATE family efflux transporter [Mediterranea sp.]
MKTNKYSYRQIWHIAYPILLSLVMEQLIGMTDTAFLGRVGEVKLGASAIAGVYYIVLFMLAFGFSIGSQILIGRRNGEGNYTAIGAIFYQGIYFLLALSVVMFAFSTVCSPYILSHLLASEHVSEAAQSYIHWRVYGFFFASVMVMFRAFFVGTTQTKTLTLNSIVMVLSNIGFNYVLIFGKLGFPAMGIAGAAIGSSLSELVSVIFFIVYTRRSIDYKKYGLNILPYVRWETLKRILNISVWTMIQNVVSLSTWFLFFLFVERLGERSLAVSNVIRSLSGIPFMISAAFGSTCSTLISNLIGAGDQRFVQSTIKQHVRIAYISSLPILLFFALFPHLVTGIYTDIEELRQAAVPALWVLCGSYLFQMPANIYFQSVSGTGNTRKAFVMEMSVLALYVAYCTYFIYYLRMNVAFAWSTEAVYGICMLIIAYWYMKRGKWEGKKI